jgi:hypothetical protein
MKNTVKVVISLSVVVLLVIILSIYKLISSPPATSKDTTGSPEQVADKRITDAKIVADKKLADAKVAADKVIADAKTVQAKKASDLKATELKAKAIEDKKVSDAKSQSEQSKELGYIDYKNERFSYSITYPDNLKIGTQTTNGSVLKSDDGMASLQLYGSNNETNESIDSIYNKAIKNNNMYYKVKSGNWFVISYTEGNEIVYQKKFVGKASTNTFIFKFPANEKDKYTNVVSKLEKSFRTSSTNSSH